MDKELKLKLLETLLEAMDGQSVDRLKRLKEATATQEETPAEQAEEDQMGTEDTPIDNLKDLIEGKTEPGELNEDGSAEDVEKLKKLPVKVEMIKVEKKPRSSVWDD